MWLIIFYIAILFVQLTKAENSQANVLGDIKKIKNAMSGLTFRVPAYDVSQLPNYISNFYIEKINK